jgi:hypothetical protein
MTVILTKSPNPKKKYRAIFVDKGKHVDFGAKGYSDYTIHRDKLRMRRYLHRHSGMGENWSPSGKYTAGYWSRWLLWNKPSMRSAIASVYARLGKPIRKHF